MAIPQIDEQYVQRIFDEITQMDFSLDEDPLCFGPKRLNAKVAQCRALLSRCERLFIQISQDMHILKREQRRLQTDFDLQIQFMLANDPVVMSGKNVRDREAIAKTRLSDEEKAIRDLEILIQDLESVMTIIKAKRADLKDMQGRIRDQIRLCQEEIGLGNRWGKQDANEPDVDIDVYSGRIPAILKELQGVAPSEGETHVGAAPDMAESEEEDPEEESIASFPVDIPVATLPAEPPKILSEIEPKDEDLSLLDSVIVSTVKTEVVPNVEEPILNPAASDTLKPTSSQNDVDAFLGDLDVGAPVAPPVVMTPAVEATDVDFDTLLNGII